MNKFKFVRSYCVYLLFYILVQFTNAFDKFDEKYDKIPVASADDQESAALSVIQRVLPKYFEHFTVIIDQSFSVNTFQIISKTETVSNVLIKGSSGTAITRGFNYFLKYHLKSQISWDGDNIDTIALPFPILNFTLSSPNRIIYYQNVCTHSYSFAWWKWQDWRKHLDWMALQGINLFIAPIQEQIWTVIYNELNMTHEEVDEHFAGPAFLAWQRMGNIRGWGGPLSANYKQWTLNLQNKIITEARKLGMKIALPGFAGHVPKALKRIFPNAVYANVTRWNKFADNYCCPLFLDPTDPLFYTIGQMFTRKVIDTYGTDHIYFSDPYNELLPAQRDIKYIGNVAKHIYQVMKLIDSNAIWLLQGWMFHSDSVFWSSEMIEAFVTANTIGTMLILDLQSEQNPQYERTNSYFGQPFIWCMLHNFGGTLGMFGSMEIINKKPMEAKLMNGSTMVGFGITPEGINQNYVMYEFALEIGWEMQSQNISEWLSSYTVSRYGFESKEINSAWSILSQTVYNYNSSEQMRGKYIYNRRPSLRLLPWTWYNSTKLKESWKLFISTAESNDNINFLFKHDLVDITRQYLQTLTDRYYLKIRKSYYRRNLNTFNQYTEEFLEIISDIDRLLKTDELFMLGSWIQSAKNLAMEVGDDNIKDLYENNSRYQITLWGPNGEIVDYANKQWSGVVMDFFLPRWMVFFGALRDSIRNNTRINNNTLKKLIMIDAEYPFLRSRHYSTRCEGDPIQISRELYDKWSTKDEEHDLPFVPYETF